MRPRFEYIRPNSLEEALEFLAHHGIETSVLAGGTDLMIAIRKGLASSKYIMDVSRLPELRQITKTQESLLVGSAATYREIMSSKEVIINAPVLACAAGHVGSPQIRNVGTIGGNVANASPAADSIPAMIVHRTWVRIESAFEQRIEPLEAVITGPYQTNLKPTELITGFLLEPLENGYSYCFQRIARRRSLSIARINAAAVGSVDESGRINDIRIAIGSATPRPCRIIPAENFLKGKIPEINTICEAAEKASSEIIRQSGIRASTEYKRPAVEGLIIKVLTEVFLPNEK